MVRGCTMSPYAIPVIWSHGVRLEVGEVSPWKTGEPLDRALLYRFKVGARSGELSWSGGMGAWFVAWDDALPGYWLEWPDEREDYVMWRLFWPDGAPA